MTPFSDDEFLLELKMEQNFVYMVTAKMAPTPIITDFHKILFKTPHIFRHKSFDEKFHKAKRKFYFLL
jgi:hypothetical protein